MVNAIHVASIFVLLDNSSALVAPPQHLGHTDISIGRVRHSTGSYQWHGSAYHRASGAQRVASHRLMRNLKNSVALSLRMMTKQYLPPYGPSSYTTRACHEEPGNYCYSGHHGFSEAANHEQCTEIKVVSKNAFYSEGAIIAT